MAQSIDDILADFGKKLVEDTKLSLQRNGHSSGQSGLIGGVKFRVLHGSDNDVVLQIIMPDYWRPVNDGARWRNKMPPANSFLPWMAQKNINGLAVYKNKLKSKKTKVTFDKAQRSLAFAIAKSIKKKGIIKRFGYKGSEFFTSLLEDGRVAELSKELVKAFGEEVKLSLKIV